MTDFDIMTHSAKLEKLFESRGINYPYLEIPQGFEISIIFPFSGATARFLIRKVGSIHRGISVYLDTKEVLGFFGAPYWEALLDDTVRFPMADTKELIATIVEYLNKKGS